MKLIGLGFDNPNPTDKDSGVASKVSRFSIHYIYIHHPNPNLSNQITMNFKSLILPIFILLYANSSSAQSVDFVQPKDGSTVTNPFKVVFAVSDMKIAPAGDMTANTGHHHLFINAENIPEGVTIPMDETHKHFGKGQTETELTLPPGKYMLTMQFANGAHQSYGPKLMKSIHITVN